MCIDCGCRRKAFESLGYQEAPKPVWGYDEKGKRIIVGYQEVSADIRQSDLSVLQFTMQAANSGRLDSDE